MPRSTSRIKPRWRGSPSAASSTSFSWPTRRRPRETHIESMKRSTQYIANFEPLTLLSALAMVTERIGLVATASTTYCEPYHIARFFASLDWLSGGRAGWNIVTTASPEAAYNFGRGEQLEHDLRYHRAREFTEVVRALWDSWDDDAFVRDKESGLFFDPEKMHYSTTTASTTRYAARSTCRVRRKASRSWSRRDHRTRARICGGLRRRDLHHVAAALRSAGVLCRRERRAAATPDAIRTRQHSAGRDVLRRARRTPKRKRSTNTCFRSSIRSARARCALTLGHDLSPYPLDGPVPDLPPPNSRWVPITVR